MAIVGVLLNLLAGGLEWLSDQVRRVSTLLFGLLPALLPPPQLMSVVRTYYGRVYSERLIPYAAHEQDWLEAWEADVFDRYGPPPGRTLVLGSGWGRESLALARRGLTVVGIDTNWTAVRTARQAAMAAGVPASFHRASFLTLPYRSAAWDHVLMGATMYSAVPGRSWRKQVIAELVRVMRPGGVLILSFLPERRPIARIKSLAMRISAVLIKLPGSNQAYQPGDTCVGGHFLHAFQNEDEICTELREAGVRVLELNWHRGYAVVTALPVHPEARHAARWNRAEGTALSGLPRGRAEQVSR